MAKRREVFEPDPVDRMNFLATVELGLPKETAAAAVGWTRAQLGSIMADDPTFAMEVEKMSARAEIKLYTRMMESGQADWRCVQQALERLHPQKYARPEVQAQLAASKIDSAALVEGMKEWLTIAEQRHSGMTVDESKAEGTANTEMIEFKDYE